MKPIVRNILIGGAIILIGASLIVKDKIETALQIFESIGIKPASLPKRVKFFEPNRLGIPQKISFEIDIRIDNPAYQEFAVSGFGVATLKQVDIYFKDYHIGTADLQLDEINVPAQSSFILPNVFFTGNTLSVLQNATAFSNLSLSDLRFTGVLEVVGVDYEIG